MINKKRFVFTLIAAAAISTSAQAENNWYVGASLDDVDVDDINTISAPVAGVARTIDVVTDSDTGIGVKLGKTLFTTDTGHQFNLELSYASSDHDVENIAFLGNDFLASDGRSEGRVDLETLLLRAVYKLDLGNFDPYVGLGLGQTEFDFDGRYGASVGQQGTPPFSEGSDDATALQYRIGVEYGLSDSIGLFLEYSRTEVDDINFSRVGGGPGGPATTQQVGDFDFDTLSFGVNYQF